MDLRKVVSELKRERDSLNRAIAALESIASAGVAAGVRKTPAAGAEPTAKKAKKHNISAEGRKSLSDLMKKRWAERRRKLAAAQRPRAKAA
jgi:hypothetical protein